MTNKTFPVRVDAKLGYFSYYAVPAPDKHRADIITRLQFENDFGCPFPNSKTHVWDSSETIGPEFKRIIIT